MDIMRIFASSGWNIIDLQTCVIQQHRHYACNTLATLPLAPFISRSLHTYRDVAVRQPAPRKRLPNRLGRRSEHGLPRAA